MKDVSYKLDGKVKSCGNVHGVHGVSALPTSKSGTGI